MPRSTTVAAGRSSTSTPSVFKPSKPSSSVKRRVEAFFDDPSMSTIPDIKSSPKRRRTTTPSIKKSGTKAQPLFLSDDDTTASSSTPTKRQRRTPKSTSEKRLRRFRAHPPGTFLQKLDRASTQRMIVLSRTRTTPLSEDIDIVGSTGNIYTVTISHVPTCTCPDSRKGNECKHKVYALHTVLRAPEHLVYQLALLTSELEEIFNTTAPPIPTETVSATEADPSVTSKRKPIDPDSECPICYMDLLSPSDLDTTNTNPNAGGAAEDDDIVWCRASCGNNMHRTCFSQWAHSQRGQTVRCVYCRADWEEDPRDLAKISKQTKAAGGGDGGGGRVNEEGYVNVAEQFGMSGVRDYTSYNQYWVRRTMGMGY